MALNVFAVTLSGGHAAEQKPGVELIVVRDLAAICGVVDYEAIEPDDAALARANEVVSEFATRGPILPAPLGVVFRSADSVRRWVELHYSALTDALSFVDNRVAARVHVRRAPASGENEIKVDHSSIASESLRVLRRAAVATLPLRADKSAGVLSSAAFLIEENSWKAFSDEVDAQAKMLPAVLFELTGPWAAYDFVQMQLGS